MLDFQAGKFGSFVYFKSDTKFSYAEFKTDISVGSFVCNCRGNPFFTRTITGNSISQIPCETQFLISEDEGSYTAYIALVDDTTRSSLRGGDGLYICSETGDEAVRVDCGLGMYVISGENVYDIMKKAAIDIKNKLGTFRLKNEKSKPEFMKYFGWCTWNALGINVKNSQLTESIESFGEYTPKFVLLDDGWQSVDKTEPGQGDWKLSSLVPKEGFDLSACVQNCKERGVEKFFVWHATMGYWAGVYPHSPEMKKYNPQFVMAKYSENLHKNNDKAASGSETSFGLVANDKIFEFYNDYHKFISSCGVDGVKIDTQNYIEAVARGRGGRSVLSGLIREGMEASVQLNFGGELINCMCGQNDTLFRLKASNMVRTSDDFFPEIPASHGIHIYNNAFTSLLSREIAWCDWDMFMTNHEYGAYHAAARAVSGGPVYVTDKIGEHDFEVISSLRLSDGTVPLCEDIAVPAPDCLMLNPFEEKKAFKIVNTNKFGRVEAAFNMNVKAESVKCRIDEPAYSFNRKCIVEGEFELAPVGFDIFTYADIIGGYGVYGIAEKYNSGGTVADFRVIDGSAYVELLDVGTVCMYSESEPSVVLCNGKSVNFEYNNKLLKFFADSKIILVK